MAWARALGGEDAAQFGGDDGGGQAGEDGADGAIEVEQEGAGLGKRAAQVLADGVEAEERLLVVDQVELEQQRGAVDADLGGHC